MVLSEDMRRIVREQKLGFVATVCPDGTPNLSPKGTTSVWDDSHLVFADLRSPGTVRNLLQNPAVEVNVVDPILRKGYRFKGTAEVHSSGPAYEAGIRFFEEQGLADARRRTRAIVLIEVTRALPLTSPAYDLGADEEEVREAWRRHFESLHGPAGAQQVPVADQGSSGR